SMNSIGRRRRMLGCFGCKGSCARHPLNCVPANSSNATLIRRQGANRRWIHAPLKATVREYPMITEFIGRRSRLIRRTRSQCPLLEPLEDRTVLGGNPPFEVGGDRSVNPANFRVTTFVSGLNYPHGMLTLSDGSLLVAVNNPVSGKSFFNTSGE